MDLHKLRCFIAVVEEGTMSKAASSLNMTQPPLSMMIQKLEKDLQVSLFDRSEKKLKLTMNGKLLYQRSLALLAFSEEIKQELIETDTGLRGTIHVGCSTSSNIFIIPQIIKRLRQENPNIVVRVSAGTSSSIFKELRKQTLDVGIVPVILQAVDYNIEHLYSEPLMLTLPPGHHLLSKEQIHLTDLSNENFLLPDTSIGESAFMRLITACHTAGFDPNIVYWGTETFPMILMAMQGVGITFAPASFRDFNLFNGIRPHFVELTSPKLNFTYSLVSYKHRFHSKVVDRFIEITKEMTQSK